MDDKDILQQKHIQLLTTNLQQLDQMSGTLILKPYQLLCSFLIFPGSDKYRFFLKHGTGLGKTLGMLLIAQNFINLNRNVFIFTFNKQLFIDDIIKFKQLNIIQPKIIENYLKNPLLNIKSLKREISEKISMYGYKKLQNRLFWNDGEFFRIDPEIIKQMYGGVIICDEIHDVYNSQEQNMWGSVLQFLSKILKQKTYFVYASATPLNNPDEVYDLIKLMDINSDQNDEDTLETILQTVENMKFKKQTDILFQHNSADDQNVYQQLQRVFQNKISFVPEALHDLPVQNFIGDSYLMTKSIKFVKCPIGQQFKSYYEKTQNYLQDEDWRSFITFDFPVTDDGQQIQKLPQFQYQFQNQDQNTLKWSKANNIDLTFKNGYCYIGGPFLLKQNIGNYSPKLLKLVTLLTEVKGKSLIYINKVKHFGAVLISNLLERNGIIPLKQMVSLNTLCFVCRHRYQEHMNQELNVNVNKLQCQNFIAYRYILVTGDTMSDNQPNLEIYNHGSNVNGERVQVVIGSKIIKQGFNILCTNNTFILTLPFNIPNLIQVIGRTARTRSHSALPENMRYVNIHVLLTSTDGADQLGLGDYENLYKLQTQSKFYGLISKDELSYYKKFRKYHQIQQYEQAMHQVSIDPQIYGNLYFQIQNSQEQQSGLDFDINNELKMIPFTQTVHLPCDNYDYLDSKIFYLRDLHKVVFNTIQRLIRQAFRISIVWSVSDLVQYVRSKDVIPNVKIISVNDIYLGIYNYPNVKIVNNHVIYDQNEIGIDFFNKIDLPFSKMQVVSINSKEMTKTHNFEARIQNRLQYIKEQLPQYYDQVQNMSIKNQKSNDSTKAILDSLPLQVVKQLKKCLQSVFNGLSNQDLEDLAQIALKQNNTKILIFIFLIFTPVTFYDVYTVKDIEDDSKIIGFIDQSYERQLILKNNEWITIQTAKWKIYYSHVIGNLLVKGFKIVQQFKSGQDKNHKMSGIECTSLDKQNLNKIYSLFNIKNDVGSKQMMCQIIQDQMLIKELSQRVNFQKNKYIQFTFN